MNKRKKKKTKSRVEFLIVFCIILMISLIIVVNSLQKLNKSEDKISDEQVQIEIQKKKEENLKNTEQSVILTKLTNMTERDRMEYYFSRFIKAIEAKNYEKAYNLLYDEYKQNYFPSLNDFEQYAKKTFPKMMSIEHTNFERSGDIYILFVTVSDTISPSEGKEMKFIVKEEALNDFVISFSVI